MKNKTIAIVINTSWNIYNFRLGLLKAFQAEGARIIAIAPRDEYSDKFEALGIEYYEIKFNNKGVNPIDEIKLTYDLYKLYKKTSPDILLHYTIKPNIYGAIAARILGIPVISNISGLGTVFLNQNISSKIARQLYRFSLYYPKIVFFQNAEDKELFIRKKLVKKSKAKLLPGSGINTNNFMPTKSIQQGDKEKSIQFLFIARLLKDKGIQEFVKASRKVCTQYSGTISIKFNILGSYYPNNPTAITRREMEAWQEEGVINYLGESDNVKSIIAKSDCIVLPSYREGLSRVLLEASSMEKPIVTTNVPGCKDVVVDGLTGYLCEVKDSQSLATQMMKIISMTQSQRLTMGKKGREKMIAEFDEKIVVGKYFEGVTFLSGSMPLTQ